MVRKISQHYRVFRFKLSLEESDELFLTFLVKKIKKNQYLQLKCPLYFILNYLVMLFEHL